MPPNRKPEAGLGQEDHTTRETWKQKGGGHELVKEAEGKAKRVGGGNRTTIMTIYTTMNIHD